MLPATFQNLLKDSSRKKPETVKVPFSGSLRNVCLQCGCPCRLGKIHHTDDRPDPKSCVQDSPGLQPCHLAASRQGVSPILSFCDFDAQLSWHSIAQRGTRQAVPRMHSRRSLQSRRRRALLRILSCQCDTRGAWPAWPVAEVFVQVQLGASRSASVHLVHLIVRLCGMSYLFAFFSSRPKSGIVVSTKPLVAEHLRRSLGRWVVVVRNPNVAEAPRRPGGPGRRHHGSHPEGQAQEARLDHGRPITLASLSG